MCRNRTTSVPEVDGLCGHECWQESAFGVFGFQCSVFGVQFSVLFFVIFIVIEVFIGDVDEGFDQEFDEVIE